jgi:hypothetical protein
MSRPNIDGWMKNDVTYVLSDFYHLLHTAHPVVQSVVPSKAPR